MKDQDLKEGLESFKKHFSAMEAHMKAHIIGQDEIVKHVLYAIVAGGHVLLEGPPGLGKTELVKQLSKVFALPFSRIQFTPDLMPSDIIGATMIENAQNLTLTFQKGPIFNSLILADEINRGTPKTQSALLEGMQEYTVTVDQTTHQLPDPFFVMATKNPLDMEGTFPLPEAQLDRFMFNLVIELPSKKALVDILKMTTVSSRDTLEKPIFEATSLKEMKHLAEQVIVSDEIMSEAVALMMRTHPDQSDSEQIVKYVKCGVSPRGVQSLIKASRVKALSEGRYHVSREDISALAKPCFRHRIFTNYHAYGDHITTDDLIQELTKG
ncbi:MAG: AAA family ATPase [Clostridia bacterium]|nr:AAA family ATPase [Clostridia bacterium]